MNQKPVICRFCRTDLRLKHGPKAPRCNVFAKLQNKDLLELHQNKDPKHVVIADCLVDLGKPLENKPLFPVLFNMCTIRRSIFACAIEKPTGKPKFGYTVELKLWNSKKKVNFPTFDCFNKQKISKKPNRLISSIEGYKDSPATTSYPG